MTIFWQSHATCFTSNLKLKNRAPTTMADRSKSRDCMAKNIALKTFLWEHSATNSQSLHPWFYKNVSNSLFKNLIFIHTYMQVTSQFNNFERAKYILIFFFNTSFSNFLGIKINKYPIILISNSLKSSIANKYMYITIFMSFQNRVMPAHRIHHHFIHRTMHILGKNLHMYKVMKYMKRKLLHMPHLNVIAKCYLQQLSSMKRQTCRLQHPGFQGQPQSKRCRK